MPLGIPFGSLCKEDSEATAQIEQIAVYPNLGVPLIGR